MKDDHQGAAALWSLFSIFLLSFGMGVKNRW